MIILSEYFGFKDPKRKKEVIESIAENSTLEEVDRILLFAERVSVQDSTLLKEIQKVEIIESASRCRYSDLFLYANENLIGEICIVCNNDISFTDSLSHLSRIDVEDMFICLTRWDVQPDGSLRHKEPKQSRKHSQDSWIFRSPLPQKMIDKGGIFFGRPGCDNMIAYLGVISGLKVLNPSELIISKHRHLSNSRNYEQNKRGTPAKDEKVGHHSLYMNVGASDTIEYDTQNLVYKLQQAWRPKDRVFNGEQAVVKAVELESGLEPIWRESTDQFS
jgi:hypothetical protein|tara:strand:+ start:2769 stop:3596 length:828 start_codon:yes stop_codon:yes gene_type:complete